MLESVRYSVITPKGCSNDKYKIGIRIVRVLDWQC